MADFQLRTLTLFASDMPNNQTTLAAHVGGGGLPFFPTRKFYQFPILPSPFLNLPQHLRCSAVSKRLLLRPLRLSRCERWNSNTETFRTRNFSFNEEEEYEGEDCFLDILDEFIDSIWVLKVFKPYFWALPPIILSLLLANGLIAFVITLALLVGQSVLIFALQKLWGVTQTNLGLKSKERPRSRTPINSNMGGRRRNPNTRKRKMGHRLWTQKADVSVGGFDEDAPTFGGWDEL
ncbi:unnamed protein product [Cuscuta campestris]|uniref:Uncharacterized protein n=1 Tax=Cuscuta campestris TaxID=132261 RepID=A0A484KNC2_9ASTE|nr:unnamed protein product [Cuscuta campestris]